MPIRVEDSSQATPQYSKIAGSVAKDRNVKKCLKGRNVMKENVAGTTEQGQIIKPLTTTARKTYKTFYDEQPSVSFVQTHSHVEICTI